MKLLRYGIISLILLVGLVTFVVNFSGSLNDTYDLTDVSLIENKSVMVALQDINVMTGLNKTIVAFKNMNKPTSTTFDVLGGLASSALGFGQIVVSLVTTPFEILHIIGEFYSVPVFFIVMLDAIIVMFVMFILVSAYLRGDL